MARLFRARDISRILWPKLRHQVLPHLHENSADLHSFRYTYYYVKAFDKASKNEGWAEKEYNRLQGLVSKGNLAPEKLDDLMSRSNILKKFLGTDDEDKSEL